MRLTMSLRVASVMIGGSPSAGSGTGRAPAALSFPAISPVTTPYRTAFSMCLNSASDCRWISRSSRMFSGAPTRPRSRSPSERIAPAIPSGAAEPPGLAEGPAHTCASKNQNDR